MLENEFAVVPRMKASEGLLAGARIGVIACSRARPRPCARVHVPISASSFIFMLSSASYSWVWCWMLVRRLVSSSSRRMMMPL
ncbi:hypothetical protein EYF80_059861 [Liparis tanakae]|uniref:Uncharacterized protein n=1 Tax=Liparis tanakae TaxID=230148 RepID=A0A4Z2EM04_9TELE|nr:hypothetical protein EYF80_059861 [Liparis tanakae]